MDISTLTNQTNWAMNGESAAVSALRQGIIDLLESPAVQAINFVIEGVSVNGDAFGQIAIRLRFWQSVKQAGEKQAKPGRYPIKITVNPHLDPAAYGSYDPFANALIFRNTNVLTTAEGRYTVIHECVHAIGDFRRVPHLRLWDEAAAYLAEHIYQFNLNVISMPIPNRPSAHIHQVASEIARYISNTGDTTVYKTDAYRLFEEVARVYKPEVTKTAWGNYDGIDI